MLKAAVGPGPWSFDRSGSSMMNFPQGLRQLRTQRRSGGHHVRRRFGSGGAQETGIAYELVLPLGDDIDD